MVCFVFVVFCLASSKKMTIQVLLVTALPKKKREKSWEVAGRAGRRAGYGREGGGGVGNQKCL